MRGHDEESPRARTIASQSTIGPSKEPKTVIVGHGNFRPDILPAKRCRFAGGLTDIAKTFASTTNDRPCAAAVSATIPRFNYWIIAATYRKFASTITIFSPNFTYR